MPDCSKSPTFDRPHMAAIHDLDVQAMGHAVTSQQTSTNQAACSMKHGSIGARLLRLHQVCWHICWDNSDKKFPPSFNDGADSPTEWELTAHEAHESGINNSCSQWAGKAEYDGHLAHLLHLL